MTFGERLVLAVGMDEYPSAAVCVDFGITDQRRYEALYYPIRAGEITAAQLDRALGNGPALTTLAGGAASNPHRDITFVTPYDLMKPGVA